MSSNACRLLGYLVAGLVLLALSPARADDTFAGDGIVLSDPTPSHDRAHAITIAGGFMYVAGPDSGGRAWEWRVEKRNLDGSLVTGFGSGGAVTSDPSADFDQPHAIVADASFLYVAGEQAAGASPFFPPAWRIEKRGLTGGALDQGFGSGGAVTIDPTSDNDSVNAIAKDATALYVVGSASSSWRIEKRSASTGALIAGFGSGGVVTSQGGEPFAVAIDASAMYVVGTNDFTNWRLEKRSLSTGALLFSVTETFPSVGCGPQGGFAIAVDAGAIYVVGEGAGAWRVERRNASDGSLVYGQGLAGSGSCDAANGIALDGSAMYVVGEHGHGWRIEKRNRSDGALVPGFGSGGAVASGSLIDAANGIAVDPGAMYVAGTDLIDGGDSQWRIEKRDLGNGALLGAVASTTTVTTSSTTTTSIAPPPCAPITLSDCRVNVKFRGEPAPRDRFNVRCVATLAGGSNGIDPAGEGVRFALTDADSSACTEPCFAQTLVPSRVGKCWRFAAASSTALGVRTFKLCDKDPARGIYRLSARSRLANLQCLNTPAPYTVALNVGDDCGPVCGGVTTTTLSATSTTLAGSTTTTTLPGGCTGDWSTGYNFPQDVDLAANGTLVYVLDTGSDRVVKVSTAGTRLGQWATGNPIFKHPRGIATDPLGDVYVTNDEDFIRKYSASGTLLAQWGGSGSGDGQLASPDGIATDAQSNVYVAERYNHRIQKFDSAGRFLAKWGTRGTGNGQFDEPRDVAVDAAGHVFVFDDRNLRVQKFDSTGQFLGKWGGPGAGFGQFDISGAPRINVDPSGNVYVCDNGNSRVQKFSGDGLFLGTWGSAGSGNGQFSTPHGIAVDGAGIAYAVDYGNGRVQRCVVP